MIEIDAIKIIKKLNDEFPQNNPSVTFSTDHMKCVVYIINIEVNRQQVRVGRVLEPFMFENCDEYAQKMIFDEELKIAVRQLHFLSQEELKKQMERFASNV